MRDEYIYCCGSRVRISQIVDIRTLQYISLCTTTVQYCACTHHDNKKERDSSFRVELCHTVRSYDKRSIPPNARVVNTKTYGGSGDLVRGRE